MIFFCTILKNQNASCSLSLFCAGLQIKLFSLLWLFVRIHWLEWIVKVNISTEKYIYTRWCFPNPNENCVKVVARTVGVLGLKFGNDFGLNLHKIYRKWAQNTSPITDYVTGPLPEVCEKAKIKISKILRKKSNCLFVGPL